VRHPVGRKLISLEDKLVRGIPRVLVAF